MTVNRRIRLVAVDIDGTLLDKNHGLSDAARLAKKHCDDRGVIFTVSTGRVSSSAERVAMELGITAPVISNGGAAIKVPGGYYLMERKVMPGAVLRALEVARGRGVERYAYASGRYITETPGDHVLPYSRGIGIPIDTVEDINEHAREEGTISLVFRLDRALPDVEQRITELQSLVTQVSEGEYRVLRTLPHMLEVLHRDANKGTALCRLCEISGVEPAESMAIGDDYGDIDMLEVAGIGLLVANAAPHLCCGRTVTRNPYAEGVLEAVTTYVL